MPQVDLVEETFIAAAPALVEARIREPEFTARLWPDLRLAVQADRGVEGLRWTASGALVGSTEIWLQAYRDGVLVHTYLRCDPTRSGRPTEAVQVSQRAATRELHKRAKYAKRVLWELKDSVEAGRRPGEPAVG
jgi:hypothetical protein